MKMFNIKDKSTWTPAMGQPPVLATAPKPGCQQTPVIPELTLSQNRKVTQGHQVSLDPNVSVIPDLLCNVIMHWCTSGLFYQVNVKITVHSE